MTNKICAKIQEGRKTTYDTKNAEGVVWLINIEADTLLRLVLRECGSRVGIGQRRCLAMVGG